MTKGLHIDRLRDVMKESYPDKVLKDLDGRTATKAPWQQRNIHNKKPFHKTRTAAAKMAGGTDEEYEDEDDVNAVDDDYNDDEDAYYEDDDYEEEEYEEDEDQVAYVDGEGWFHAEEDVINAIDDQWHKTTMSLLQS